MTASISKEAVRERFEKWVEAIPCFGSFRITKRENGDYDSSHTHLMWLSAQAAITALLESGEVVVANEAARTPAAHVIGVEGCLQRAYDAGWQDNEDGKPHTSKYAAIAYMQMEEKQPDESQRAAVRVAQEAYYENQKVGYVYPCPTGMEAALRPLISNNSLLVEALRKSEARLDDMTKKRDELFKRESAAPTPNLEAMREEIEGLKQSLVDYQMALELAPEPISMEWITQLKLRISKDLQALSIISKHMGGV